MQIKRANEMHIITTAIQTIFIRQTTFWQVNSGSITHSAPVSFLQGIFTSVLNLKTQKSEIIHLYMLRIKIQKNFASIQNCLNL